MNLLILEYVSGGGYADQKLSSSILSEAYGMLRSLVSDFKTAGHNVTTLMDSRLAAFDAPMEADKIVSVRSSKEVDENIRKFSKIVDAVYVIAPESNQVLEKLLQTVNGSGAVSLNCEVDAVKRVSNKIAAHEMFKQSGVSVPDTVLLDIEEKTENIKRLVKELEYPMVFKPVDGTSCSGLSVIKNEKEVPKAVKKVAHESMSRKFVAQKLVKGEAASACVISSGNKALAVSLNRQLVYLASPDFESTYVGGEVPFNHRLEKEAMKAAERAVEAVNGLKGYVGVDLLLTDEEPVVIEVNPRLTVSYIGLQKVANFNVSNAIIDAVTRQKLPAKTQTTGYSFFSKIQVPCCPQNVPETYNLKDVVSPPFPTNEKKVIALIASNSSTSKGAKSAFIRTKKRLLSICGDD